MTIPLYFFKLIQSIIPSDIHVSILQRYIPHQHGIDKLFKDLKNKILQ